jgi:hypothetical protein
MVENAHARPRHEEIVPKEGILSWMIIYDYPNIVNHDPVLDYAHDIYFTRYQLYIFNSWIGPLRR